MVPDILELVAEDVHTEWMNEKQRQGFANHLFTGEQENWPCKTPGCHVSDIYHHTDMQPYADLPEHIKKYDRVTTQTVVDSLKNRGYLIIHLKTGEEI
jgi:hypothetical protein